MKHPTPTLSIVVPVYNEAQGLATFHEALVKVASELGVGYEIVYVNDGSNDSSLAILQELATKNPTSAKVLALTRNFGKEVATSAGLQVARGAAILTVDADGQHPIDLLPVFVEKWSQGAKVVVGKRAQRQAPPLKRFGSRAFYGVFRRFTRMRLQPDLGDFRLIDREVCDQFNTLTERNRITRGLIDWFGYKMTTIPYQENSRLTGTSTYNFRKLSKLAIDSMISLSTSPLYVAAYAGGAIIFFSLVAGIVMLSNFLLHDPLGLRATASAYGLVLILFLIGMLLVSQGIIGLYLAHIHAETQNRPLYVVDKQASKNL
ncbi:MAG: glycosyltransferase [Candidatus Saccharimonadales bacterium]